MTDELDLFRILRKNFLNEVIQAVGLFRDRLRPDQDSKVQKLFRIRILRYPENFEPIHPDGVVSLPLL